jgi:tripartite-type tricarboxylate transporter receptor subunit TctC
MKLPRRNFLHLAAAAAALPAVSCFAFAQAYPSRPVRIIIGFAPGGVVEIVARLIGQWLSERLGQPFIIDTRPGAGSNIATEAVVRHRPRAGCSRRPGHLRVGASPETRTVTGAANIFANELGGTGQNGLARSRA